MTLLSAVVIENVAQLAREGLGLTGVSGLPAEEAAVVVREHGRVVTEQLGGRHSRASSEGASDSSPTAITSRVGAANRASTSGR